MGMNKLQKGISIALLMIAGATGAFAAPGRGPDERDGDRGARQQQRQAERNEAQQDRRGQPGPEGQGRHGRMSPEERKALRQQINEANQDIFRPKR
jgi:hypothetical protein